MNDLVAMLEATGNWWMIGKGQVRAGEPMMGCVIQEPRIGGRMIAKTEGDDLADCVVRAIDQARRCVEAAGSAQRRRREPAS